jgi:hypothetical protein
MSDVNVIAVIRKLHGQPEGSKERIDAGTTIHAWSLFTENGSLVDISELDDKQLFEAYSRSQEYAEEFVDG